MSDLRQRSQSFRMGYVEAFDALSRGENCYLLQQAATDQGEYRKGFEQGEHDRMMQAGIDMAGIMGVSLT